MIRFSLSRRARRWLIAVAVVLVLILVGGYVLFRIADSRTFQFFGGLTARVETPEKAVALTFDDGPSPAGVKPVLDTLAARDVHATFYLIGSELAAHPDLGRAIAAAGHEIGNHTYSHERMLLITPGYAASEIERTDALIRATGYPGEITVRPPNGKKLFALPYYLHEHDRKTITWDVEPNSFPEIDRSAAAIADYTVTHVRPGSIVLFHAMYPGREQTRQAIGPAVDRLRALGYRFVTVSELLALRGKG
ncbi:polysaccharide deacetylase family protein [Amycolatopsis rubida]|nr:MULTISPECIES: polysaccharide deacetylase family protein [Amycolatopsis]MYW92469.1 polysaccharide deacetylase family protein [Amycolatopsis rubida]NEC57457.1 polysaccharide deacetylase family protein [Amycolatopsis rubida]OAP26959.1 Peptidoglycan-N-acetylglucosamine deacetylase [Amycolatopsis sp. M39]